MLGSGSEADGNEQLRYSQVCVLTTLAFLWALCRQGFRNCIRLVPVLCLSQREPFPYVGEQGVDDTHLLLLHQPLLDWGERDMGVKPAQETGHEKTALMPLLRCLLLSQHKQPLGRSKAPTPDLGAACAL